MRQVARAASIALLALAPVPARSQTTFVVRDVRTIEDLGPQLLDEIEHFFVSYNEIRGKTFMPTGRKGPQAARNIVVKAAKPRKRATSRRSG